MNADHTVTFPLRTGRYADGRSVDHIVIGPSDVVVNCPIIATA